MKSTVRKSKRFTWILGILLSSSVLSFFSCKKDRMAVDSFTKIDLKLNDLDCFARTIKNGMIKIGGPYHEKKDQKVMSTNNNLEKVELIYFNTETDFIIKVRSTEGWKDLFINDIDAWTGKDVSSNEWGELSYPLDINWQPCDLEHFKLTVITKNQPVYFQVNYNLYGLEYDDCKTYFTRKVISNGSQCEVNYTFNSADEQDYIEIKGDLTSSLGLDADIKVAGGNLSVSQGKISPNGKRIIKIAGSVEECEPIIINIKWKSGISDGKLTDTWSINDENGLELAPAINGLECLLKNSEK
jgi:hypothetical protein